MSITVPVDFLNGNNAQARFIVYFYDVGGIIASRGYAISNFNKYDWDENVINSVSSISFGMNPVSHVFETSECIIECDLDWIRSVIWRFRLKGRLVRIYIGDHDTADNAFIHYYSGFIKSDPDINQDEKKATITLIDLFSKLKECDCRSYVDGDVFINTNPIECIYNVISEFYAAALIDSTTFDVSDSEYVDMSHIVVSRGGFNPVGYGDDMKWIDTGVTKNSISAYDLITDICKYVRGILYVNEDGKIACKLAGGSTVANLTDDDILVDSFKQISDETITINKVIMHYDKLYDDREAPKFFESQFDFYRKNNVGVGEYTQTYELKNTTSVSNHAVTDVSNDSYTLETSCDWIQNKSDLAGDVSATDTISIIRGRTHAFSGTQELYPNLVTGVQSAEYQPDYLNDRYVHIAYVPYTTATTFSKMRVYGYEYNSNSFIKANTEILREGSQFGANLNLPVPEQYYQSSDGLIKNIISWFEITTSLSDPFVYDHDSIITTNSVNGTACFDVTLLNYFGSKILERFSDGCPVVELKTSFKHYGIDIGDIVTITNETFVYYDMDGVTDSDSFECISKQPDHDRNEITFKFMYYGANADALTDDYFTNPFMRSYIDGGVPNDDLASHILDSGFTATDAGGLNINLSGGSVNSGAATSVPVLNNADNFLLTASKDTYIYYDGITKQTVFHETALGAGAPTLGRFQKMAAKVVTDGASIVSITDLKDTDRGFKSTMIGDKAVATAKLDDDAVTTVKINTSAVTESKIATNAVTAAKITTGAVETAKLDDEVVTTAKVGAGAVATHQTTSKTFGRNHNFDLNLWSRG